MGQSEIKLKVTAPFTLMLVASSLLGLRCMKCFFFLLTTIGVLEQ